MEWFRKLVRARAQRRLNALDITQFTPFPEGGYLVGGALRDALLGRDFDDLDWLVADPQGAAQQAAARLGGRAFLLDAARGHWRVVASGHSADYSPLRGALETDLRARDYRVNALAADAQGRILDPLGGLADLRSGTLCMVSPATLRADALRPLRGVRLAASLAFALEPATQAAIAAEARAQAEGEGAFPAWERVGDELDRLLLSAHAASGLRLLDTVGLLALYLPELAAGREVAQGGFHHQDVLAHNIETLAQLVRLFPGGPLSLRWGALLHDLGKPATRTTVAGGRASFYGHDKRGAELALTLLRRLRRAEAKAARVASLVRYHMLPLPGSDKEARRFLHRRRALLPELLELMIADCEAARGPLSSDQGRARYRLALVRILKLIDEVPARKPPLGGHEVMALLGLAPGPRVGEAVRFLHEAAAVGDVHDREDAEAALRHFARNQGWTPEGR